MTPKLDDVLLTRKEAAAFLGVNVRTLDRYRSGRHFPKAIRPGGPLSYPRWSRKQLEGWVQRRTEGER